MPGTMFLSNAGPMGTMLAVVLGGFDYRIAGYDVFGGEILLTMLVLTFFWLLSRYEATWARKLHTALAMILLMSVIFLSVALLQKTSPLALISPAFQPNFPIGMQVFSMLMLAPWMFVGVESVTHATEKFGFSVKSCILLSYWLS